MNAENGQTNGASGPLVGLRVVEFAGIGPVPFAGMLLSDMGADVVLIDRPGSKQNPSDITGRGRHRIEIDLKDREASKRVIDLCSRSDVILEGFRPGVMERLGLGPDVVFARSPRVIYGRMTGWGQSGPLAGAAGHDINYISLSGALAAIGSRHGKPIPPLNLVGDYGGGALYLVVGVLAALYEARISGQGQIVDAAMIDGASSLMTIFYSLLAQGMWSTSRESNVIDGAAPYYGTYECSDGNFISVGAIEPQFYRLLHELSGLSSSDIDQQNDRSQWKAKQARLEILFKSRSRKEWCELLEGTDVCFAPVLTIEEAPFHHHNVEREAFVKLKGVVQPAPAPRFSRTKSTIQFSPGTTSASITDQIEKWS